jgi:hypothetical protein
MCENVIKELLGSKYGRLFRGENDGPPVVLFSAINCGGTARQVSRKAANLAGAAYRSVYIPPGVTIQFVVVTGGSTTNFSGEQYVSNLT